ncbi:MAG: hypothetical protein R2854_03680 [Caldilineaceae bacterium]
MNHMPAALGAGVDPEPDPSGGIAARLAARSIHGHGGRLSAGPARRAFAADGYAGPRILVGTLQVTRHEADDVGLC